MGLMMDCGGIMIFISFDTYLEAVTTKGKRALRQLVARFVICGESLYRRIIEACNYYV